MDHKSVRGKQSDGSSWNLEGSWYADIIQWIAGESSIKQAECSSEQASGLQTLGSG